MKKKIMFALSVILLSISAWIFDDIQQLHYEGIRTGYRLMEEGRYEEAVEKFDLALKEHPSELYWKIEELVNGKDCILTRDNIMNAMKQCQKNM